jgi:FkbM family methyltransferase
MIDRLIQVYAHTPEHPAKLRLFFWLYRLLRGRARIEVDVGGALRMRLSPDDHIEACILFDDWHEPLTTRFLLANARPGETAVAAGAHIGYHTMHLARAVGPDGRVVACEPEPANLLRAWEHLRLNRLTGVVRLVGHALGRAPTYVAMAEPPADSAGTAALGVAAAESPYRAYVERIDTLFARLSLDRLDLLQLDVEGFERDALEGLGALRPRLIVLESDPRHHTRVGPPQAEFFAFVRALGYELHALDGTVVRAEGFYPETNLVAVRLGEATPTWPIPSAA